MSIIEKLKLLEKLKTSFNLNEVFNNMCKCKNNFLNGFFHIRVLNQRIQKNLLKQVTP